jgi:hypothetical protein
MKYLLLTMLLLLLACGYCAKGWQKAKAETDRLSRNQSALLTDIEQYKTDAGNNAARVWQLELTKNEFERQCADLKKQVNELGVKTKYLQQIINAGVKTEVKIQTVVRDSIVYRDMGRQDTMKCIDFATPYFSIAGCISNDTVFNGSATHVDTLSFVAHRVPKRFLFFRWGTKGVLLDVVVRDTCSRLTYNRYVKIK